MKSDNCKDMEGDQTYEQHFSQNQCKKVSGKNCGGREDREDAESCNGGAVGMQSAAVGILCGKG